ncbi:MAG: hypothetical protein IJM84_06660 [Bacteroidaceae bacterium]|nr:hypothetical protein [Bacteroidaceae bacterium]
MILKLRRIAKKQLYTIGKLYINGAYFCDTIEDKDRGLTQMMPLDLIKKIKVYKQTAIPTGTYTVAMGTRSPKFSQKPAYNFTEGRLPRLLSVPGYDGILIHAGTNQNSSAGCLIVGQNKVVGQVINSMATFKKLWNILDAAYKQGDKISIVIE